MEKTQSRRVETETLGTSLKEVGLSTSEIKVYLALLELGSSQKGPLVKRSGISPSKIYEVADRLIKKGLVSDFQNNNIRHFVAAPPSRITAYLEERKNSIQECQERFNAVLPQLELRHSMDQGKTDAFVFHGWKGLETVYQDVLDTLQPGEVDLVFGANKGTNAERVLQFYTKWAMKAKRKGIRSHIIFNEDTRKYYGAYLKANKQFTARYMSQTTPTEINIYRDRTLLVTLEDEPLAVLIKSEKTANSFREYFKVMWGLAKP